MNKAHKIEKAAALLFLVFSLALLAGFLPIHLGPLDRTVENVLKGVGADTVAVGEVSVILWRGIRVKDLTAGKRVSANEDYFASVQQADISCNLFGMALTFLTTPNILKSDRDLFREAYEKPIEFVGDACLLAMSLGPLTKITLRDAGINVTRHKSKGKGKDKAAVAAVPWVNAGGVSAALAVRGRGGKRALDGSVSVKSASVQSIAAVNDFRVKLRVTGGTLAITDGRGDIFGGKLNVEASLDLDSSRFTGGKARINGLDLEQYCDGTDFSPGRLSGTVNLDAEIEKGSPAALDSIKAKGSFNAANLTAAETGLQKTQAVNKLSRELRTLGFGEVRGDFQLDAGKIRFGEIAAVGDIMTFKSSGWADFEGKLAQDFAGELDSAFVRKLPKLVRNGLEKTENGGGRFNCRITGTFHKPRVEVDKAVYNRAFKSLFK